MSRLSAILPPSSLRTPCRSAQCKSDLTCKTPRSTPFLSLLRANLAVLTITAHVCDLIVVEKKNNCHSPFSCKIACLQPLLLILPYKFACCNKNPNALILLSFISSLHVCILFFQKKTKIKKGIHTCHPLYSCPHLHVYISSIYRAINLLVSRILHTKRKAAG